MAEAELSPAGRRVLAVGYGMIDHVNAELPDCGAICNASRPPSPDVGPYGTATTGWGR